MGHAIEFHSLGVLLGSAVGNSGSTHACLPLRTSCANRIAAARFCSASYSGKRACARRSASSSCAVVTSHGSSISRSIQVDGWRRSRDRDVAFRLAGPRLNVLQLEFSEPVATVKRPLLKLALAAAATLLCLVVAELAVRIFDLAPDLDSPYVAWEKAADPGGAPRMHVVTQTPELYGLNPKHPAISAQGFRSEAVAVPKPVGVFRVLILGDSVAYGHDVRQEAAFPQQLQQLLRKQGKSVEVVNAGVSGYTAYNELQAYLAHGRQLQPDLVIVAMCLNDVVNPRMHWGVSAGKMISIPDEAIPDLQYDRSVILPRIAATMKIDGSLLTMRNRTFADNFALYRFVKGRTSGWTADAAPAAGAAATDGAAAADADVQTFLTSEDPLSIEVMMDANSCERRWLHVIYEQLASAVAADGARFAIVIAPLAYQLDADYPFIPQHDLSRAFEAAGWPRLDLLPTLRPHPVDDVFIMQRSGYNDVWHLTEAGHVLVAAAIAQFLEQHGLLVAKD